MTAKPYTTVCISVYESDLADIDRKVSELRARGLRGMNRSMLLRLAAARLRVDDVCSPPPIPAVVEMPMVDRAAWDT